jgi:toxin-antitoxin system PIN domain toxin
LILVDVNVLVYAHRRDARGHARYREWFEATVNDEAAFGVSELVLSGFVRIVTHPRVFNTPTPIGIALSVAGGLLERSNCVRVNPGPRHWGIFRTLCGAADARGNLVSDAYLAAVAIESGSEWITTDRDYARFPGLRWRHPLE